MAFLGQALAGREPGLGGSPLGGEEELEGNNVPILQMPLPPGFQQEVHTAVVMTFMPVMPSHGHGLGGAQSLAQGW